MSDEQFESDQRDSAIDFNAMVKIFVCLCIVISIIIPVACYGNNYSAWLYGVGLSFGILVAAGLSGGMLGFIFSVPYVNQVTGELKPNDEASRSKNAETGPVIVQAKPLLRSNSNLEKISDWLTTMLVGIGISQINQIFVGLNAFGEFLSPLDTITLDGVQMTVGRMKYVGPTLL